MTTYFTHYCNSFSVVITDPIPVGVPLTAGAGGPGVFNANDVLVMKALICKYMCKKKSGNFNREDFFRAILDGEFSQGGAFKEGLEKDKMNGYPEFDELVDYCLNSLVRNELMEQVIIKEPNQNEYLGTQRLRSFCSDILKFEMLDVEGLVKAVTEGVKEIRYDKSSSAIINLLQSLKDGKQVLQDEATQRIKLSTLTKLVQLGIILVSFSNMISISSIGERVLSELTSH